MKVLLAIALSLTFWIAGCQAHEAKDEVPAKSSAPQKASSDAGLREELYSRARKRTDGKEPTRLDLFNELLIKGKEATGGQENKLASRLVARGAKPEFIVRDDRIYLDGKLLSLGSSLSTWLHAIPGAPKCSSDKSGLTLCVWDDLGIMVGTSAKHPNIAKFVDITLNVEPPDPYFPDRPSPFTPQKAFLGYFELDGYGIDAQTKFHEVRSNADPKRNLRCDSHDCSHPHGKFSDKATLYMRLNGVAESSTIYEVQIGARDE